MSHGGTELEPYFVKALKLLQSRTKESTNQLKAMLDDVIAQRKGLKPSKEKSSSVESGTRDKSDAERKSRRDSESGGDNPVVISSSSSSSCSSSSSSKSSTAKNSDHRKSEAGEKRSAKFDDALVDFAKKPKLCDSDHGSSKSDSSEDPQGLKTKKKKHKSDHHHHHHHHHHANHKKKSKKNKHHRKDGGKEKSDEERSERLSSVELPPSVEVNEVEEKFISGEDSDGDGSTYNSESEGTGGGLSASGGSSGVADIDAFADSLGVSCVTCKSFDVQTGNQLVECQDCRSLYHQECHRPKISDDDVNDPRHVWYCSRCKKNMKKMANEPRPLVPISPKTTTSTTPTTNSNNEKSTSAPSPGANAPPRLTFTFTSTPSGSMTMTPSAHHVTTGVAGDHASSSTTISSDAPLKSPAKTRGAASVESKWRHQAAPTSATSTALSGLASLAANLNKGGATVATASSSSAATSSTPSNIWGAFSSSSSSSSSSTNASNGGTSAANAATVATSASQSGTTSQASGLAGLAANHAANRRLQDMKKRAAAKTQPQSKKNEGRK